MSERRLGRGLEALLGPMNRDDGESQEHLREIAVDAVRPNPYQPRHAVDEDGLVELAASIKSSGLLQPVVVRETDDGYQLIAGERRWRAVQRLGWEKVPAVIRVADDRTLLTMALIENLQRDDLNPIDEAMGYDRLGTEFSLSVREVARLVGKDRSTVANSLRLLKLPAEVRDMVRAVTLSAGHARALLGLPTSAAMIAKANEAVEHDWSVRQMESDVQQRPGSPSKRQQPRHAGPHQATVEARRIEDALRQHLGTDIRLTAKRKGRGLLTISYYSNEDLARLLELILGRPFEG